VAADSEVGLLAAVSVVRAFVRASSAAPDLGRASAPETVSFSGIAWLSRPFPSGSVQVSTVPRVGVGCRPPGAGSVLGSVTTIETVQLVRVAP
jgi:hypothetical protein